MTLSDLAGAPQRFPAGVGAPLGIAQSHLSALERGEREPCAAVLLAIGREFGKSADWLLTGEEKK